MSSSIAQRLHADALRSILLFLHAEEMIAAVSTCSGWRHVALQPRSFRVSYEARRCTTARLISLAASPSAGHHIARISAILIGPDDLPLLCSLPSLTSLQAQFSQSKLHAINNNADAAAFDTSATPLRLPPHLRDLDVKSNGPRTALTQSLVDSFASLTHLTTLNASLANCVNAQYDGSSLSQLVHLTHLCVWNTTDAKTIQAIRSLSNLRTLVFASANVEWNPDGEVCNSADLRSILDSRTEPHQLQKLEEIDVSRATIDAQLRDELLQLRSLTKLHIFIVATDCYAGLLQLPHLRSLTCVQLRWQTGLNQDQMESFASALNTCMMLEELHIRLRLPRRDKMFKQMVRQRQEKCFWSQLNDAIRRLLPEDPYRG